MNTTFSRIAPFAATLGAVATIAVAAPAQAADLSFSDATSDFFGLVQTGGVFNPSFDVTFVPVPGGLLLSEATSFFGDVLLPPATPRLEEGNNFLATFNLLGSVGDVATYVLAEDLEVTFTGDNGFLTVNYGAGSEFQVTVGGTEASVVKTVTDPSSFVNVNGDVFTPANSEIFSLTLTFDDNSGPGLGSFSGTTQIIVEESVPEPGTMLGLAAVSGLGLLAKRKKQAV
ncbi:MAG: PEP-CTERM sorting domain-containing protein [Chloroflexaceae bacterium]|nr:PEP-CTERM sorting domain-containing protein [Chloroflexaceae bacterium]